MVEDVSHAHVASLAVVNVRISSPSPGLGSTAAKFPCRLGSLNAEALKSASPATLTLIAALTQASKAQASSVEPPRPLVRTWFACLSEGASAGISC